METLVKIERGLTVKCQYVCTILRAKEYKNHVISLWRTGRGIAVCIDDYPYPFRFMNNTVAYFPTAGKAFSMAKKYIKLKKGHI
jgi:hypothetical protein